MLIRSPFFLAAPASWVCTKTIDTMADDTPAPCISNEIWHTELQHYVNTCSRDEDIFDFGTVYGEINRQKGVKAKDLLKLQLLIERLLAISAVSKVRKPELVSAVAFTLDKNKHRQILPKRSRDEVHRYVVSQASHPLVSLRVDCRIVRLAEQINTKQTTTTTTTTTTNKTKTPPDCQISKLPD